MFQNVVEEVENKSGDSESILKIKEILKGIFKYQNIFIYILSFFLSMISFQDGFAPFGIIMLAACLSSTIPVIGVFLISLVGTLIGQGLNAMIIYFITSAIYFLLVVIFKPKVATEERNEVLKTGNRLFWAYFIVNIISKYNSTSSMLTYNIFMSLVYAGIVYVFYKIFVNGLIVLKDFKIKDAFTIEEVVGASIIVSIAATAINGGESLNLNLSYILACFMIMLLSFENGLLTGMATGLSLGLVFLMLGTGNIQLLVILTFAGILSGLLNKFGKIGTIIGFVLGNMMLTYLYKLDMFSIISYQSLIASAILMLIVPKRVKIQIEDLVGKSKLLSNLGENRLTENSDIADKLSTLSSTIIENTKEVEEKIDNISNEFIQAFLDNLEGYENNILYDEIANNEEIAKDVFECIQEKEIVVENDLIEILEKHNNYIFMQDEAVKNDLQEIIKIINRTYKMVQIELTKKTEKIKQQKILKQSLQSVSKVIENCANEIRENKESRFVDLEKEIKIVLESKNIKIFDVQVKQAKNKKYIILLNLDINVSENLRDKAKINNISDILSKIVKCKITFQKDYKSLEKNEYIQTYSSEDKFIMQVGTAKISEENSKMSGDCNLQIRINDGKYVLAICDGMGTGENARKKSKTAITTLKNLLEKGFEKEESVSLINSMLNQNNSTDTYTSMDIAVLDLFTGNAEFMKNGACNTYIKNKKNIKIISSTQSPIGILEKVELIQNEIQVNDGDIILMCSDGVLDAKENYNKDWIEDFLKNISTNNVQKMADMILAEAIDNSYGIANDDMTVIVAKIVKKK